MTSVLTALSIWMKKSVDLSTSLGYLLTSNTGTGGPTSSPARFCTTRQSRRSKINFPSRFVSCVESPGARKKSSLASGRFSIRIAVLPPSYLFLVSCLRAVVPMGVRVCKKREVGRDGVLKRVDEESRSNLSIPFPCGSICCENCTILHCQVLLDQSRPPSYILSRSQTFVRCKEKCRNETRLNSPSTSFPGEP